MKKIDINLKDGTKVWFDVDADIKQKEFNKEQERKYWRWLAEGGPFKYTSELKESRLDSKS